MTKEERERKLRHAKANRVYEFGRIHVAMRAIGGLAEELGEMDEIELWGAYEEAEHQAEEILEACELLDIAEHDIQLLEED